MLVLSRGIGETLTIGDAIRITILDVEGGQVRIGIEAPRQIAVDREEVYLRKRSELERAGIPTEEVSSCKKIVAPVIRKRSPLYRARSRHNT